MMGYQNYQSFDEAECVTLKPNDVRFYVVVWVRERHVTCAIWAPDKAKAEKIVNNHYNWKGRVQGVMEVQTVRALTRMLGRDLSEGERTVLITKGTLPEGVM